MATTTKSSMWAKTYDPDRTKVGGRVTVTPITVWHDDDGRVLCATAAGAPFDAEIVEVGAHWSDSVQGTSGYWVRVEW